MDRDNSHDYCSYCVTCLHERLLSEKTDDFYAHNDYRQNCSLERMNEFVKIFILIYGYYRDFRTAYMINGPRTTFAEQLTLEHDHLF